MSPYLPLIGVVAYHLADDRVPRWPAGGYGVPAPYIEALRCAEARTAIISPGEPGEAEEILEPFDGLLLVGGGDVDPRRYGAEPDAEHNYGVEEDRDELEIGLIRAAERMRVPLLCICRGAQVLNVAHGGTLHQHLPDLPDLLEHGVPLDGTETNHDVEPVPGTFLSATTKSGTLRCRSHHHQGIDRVAEGLRVSGRSADGLAEAVELDVPIDGNVEEQPWVVGVQWHPEETAADDPIQQSLFDALALIARIHGSRAKPAKTQGRTRGFSIERADPGWPRRFETESARIRAALPTDLVDRIEHVGSTSVPGLDAKGTIDIQLSVRAMVPRDAYVGPLRELGYRWLLDPWDDEHEYFSRDEDGERAFQIHVCPSGSAWERRHLAFRDRLRAHPEEAAEYAELKRRLAERHPNDVFSYTAGKTAFIREIEARAHAGPSDSGSEREVRPVAKRG